MTQIDIGGNNEDELNGDATKYFRKESLYLNKYTSETSNTNKSNPLTLGNSL